MNKTDTPEDGERVPPVSSILERVGARVRAKRAERRMPRRVLSEISDVSPRYLAQLESGQGNISIALLDRVATALNASLLDLVGDADDVDEQRMVRLFRTADRATRSAVLQRLEVAAELPDRAQRVCLIGLRGAGKSTLGARAGAGFGVPFLELNQDIEAQGGMPVSEIMSLYGTEGYRQLEADAVRRVAARHDRLVLAVAGGIVSAPQTYQTLRAHYHTIWIKASAEEHLARVKSQGDAPPAEGVPKALEHLRGLLEERQDAFAKSDAVLDTTGQSPAQSTQALIRLIEARGYLK